MGSDSYDHVDNLDSLPRHIRPPFKFADAEKQSSGEKTSVRYSDMCAPYHVFVPLALLIIISSVEGGILKDLLQGRRTEGIGSTMQLPTPAPSRQPLHRNEQNYLYDSTEVNRKTTMSEKKTQNTIVPMKDIGNGVFEFEVGVRKCKFYTDNRQAQRSLMCNAKQCSAYQKKWLCGDRLSCSITVCTHIYIPTPCPHFLQSWYLYLAWQSAQLWGTKNHIVHLLSI